MEMQGRQDEGIDLLEKHERYFGWGQQCDPSPLVASRDVPSGTARIRGGS
jgi:hypothetical protein